MIQQTRIDSSSVVVVSGGAKGITAQCVLKLARQYLCQWILLGRSEFFEVEPIWAENCFDEAELKRRIMQDFLANGEKPTPIKVQRVFKQISSSREIGKTIASLKALGRQVEYLNVDITDASNLKTKLTDATQSMGKISSIIHGAGNIADKWIENKTEQDFENVYAAKVKGLENLLSCVPPEQLDYLILFSSVAGFFGSAGQSDYALANEILNKSAHLVKQLHPSCRVVAINWGPWESGMVTSELKKAFAQRKIEIIPIEAGTQMLVEELERQSDRAAQVVIGSVLTPPPQALDEQLRSYRIRRHLSIEANPFLQAHAIGGNLVLPATCAAAWAIDLCEQLYPGYQFTSLKNFRVLKGIVFDGNQADEFIADVREIAKTNDAINFEVRIWSENEGGKIRFHYTAEVELKQHIACTSEDNFWAREPKQTHEGLSFYRNKTLFHGAFLQGIKSVGEIDAKTLKLDCLLAKIPERQQGQFLVKTFNPFVADVFLQGILVWLSLFEDTRALPAEIQQINQFKPLSFEREIQAVLEVVLKTETKITVNITAYDEKGRVYLRLTGVNATISQKLTNLFAHSTE